MDLYEWTKQYIIFRDILKKQIVKKTKERKEENDAIWEN